MEVTSMHLGQQVSCNCNVTDSLLISAPLASDALLLRCCPQLLPASSLPFPQSVILSTFDFNRMLSDLYHRCL